MENYQSKTITKFNNTIKNEIQLLLICSKTELYEEDIAFILSYFKQTNHNLNTLFYLINKHGVIPIVYKTLKSKKSLINSEEFNLFLTILKTKYMEISQRNMFMSVELIDTMKLFKKNGIEAISFKGPTLSQMAYDDITLRQYSDLDILVSETQVAKASKILQKNSYKLLYPQKVLTNRICLNTLIDVGFMHNSVHIELHWKLLQTKHAGADALTQLANFTKDVNINHNNIPSLSNELLLVYLCLHGSKHTWERIGWICDIDRLIRVQKFNWEKSIEIANTSKMKKAFFLGLGLSHHFFNTPLPKEILNKVKTLDIDTLKQITINQLNTSMEQESDSSRNKKIFLYQIKLFDSISNKIAFILHSFFKISPADCITYILPEKLKFLYIILRPFRLVGNYTKF